MAKLTSNYNCFAEHECISAVDGFLMKYYSSGGQWDSFDKPCGALTTKDRIAKVQCVWLDEQFRSELNHQSINMPAGTIMTTDKHCKVTAHFLDRQFSQGTRHESVNGPAGAVLTVPKMNLVSIKAVAGVSVGALNGIMVATRQFDAMRTLWENITPDQVLKKRGIVRVAGSYLLHKIGIHKPPLGFYSNAPLKELVHKYTMNQVSHIPFMSGVVDIETGEYYDFGLDLVERGTFITKQSTDHVIASATIPIIFDPIQYKSPFDQDRLLVDGGIRHQSPIGTVLEMFEPDKLTIITCGQTNSAFYKPVKDIVDVAQNTIATMNDEIFNKDLREFQRVNELTEIIKLHRLPVELPYEYYPNRVIMPAKNLGDVLDFSTDQAQRNFKHGRDAAMRSMELQEGIE